MATISFKLFSKATLGPSGCGKTTILRMIAGFENPNNGEIFIEHQMINHFPPEKRDTAMVFQSYALFPHYNVFDNVAYGLKLKKLPKPEIAEKVANILRLVDLEGLEDRAPNQLSGGQQQRVALARALTMEPSILLFDEPLSNLDAKLRVYMRTEIRKIQQKLGITSIYVTHDQFEAMSLSDRIIVMNEGRIEQIGTPQEIYQKPATEFVANFIGTANIFEGKINSIETNDVVVDIFGKLVKIPTSKRFNQPNSNLVKIVSRPEGGVVSEASSSGFAGLVTFSAFMGEYQEYHIEIQGKNFVIHDYNPVGKRTYQKDDEVKIDFRLENLHIIP